MTFYTKDIKLIQDIQLKATGANIHSVNEAVCNYKAFVDMINGKAWWVKKERFTEENRQYWKICAELWEIHMRKFLATSNWSENKPRVIF